MRIIDLLRKSSVKKIMGIISYYYGNKEYDKFEELIDKLINFNLKYTKESEYVIYVEVSNKYSEYFKDEIKKYDFQQYFDVSAIKNGEKEIYSISSSDYNSFLQCEVDVNTLNTLSYEAIIAHCLYEITSYGFEDFVKADEIVQI
ncbi:MAG: hypothetical protein LBM93_07580 [Oscillospiraceae bacterium]|jgi:phage anti-repressor protein|nr:hypothetical protein [Oscillospiraceae bacterium]